MQEGKVSEKYKRDQVETFVRIMHEQVITPATTKVMNKEQLQNTMTALNIIANDRDVMIELPNGKLPAINMVRYCCLFFYIHMLPYSLLQNFCYFSNNRNSCLMWQKSLS